MSGRMSKLSKTDSTGPLSEVEVSRCAELVHRAIVHEQGWRLVQAVGRHIHGRGTEVHAQDLLDKVQQGMSDASKRRLDTDSEWEALTEQCGTEPRDEDPSLDFAEGYKSPVQKPCASGAPMASYAPAGGQVVIPLPPGVQNVNEWGRTIIKMKKYSDENITYDELIYRATNCTETARYIQWIRSNYTPANEDIEKCKKTQAVDFALYLKKIKWQRQETSEFTRCLK